MRKKICFMMAVTGIAVSIFMLSGICTAASKPTEPVFSEESGWQKESFELKITSASEEAVIYYTTDGSEPDVTDFKQKAGEAIEVKNCSQDKNKNTEKTDIVYPASSGISLCYTPGSQGILVDKCMVIRAAAIAPDGTKSNIVTKTYFIGNDMERYNQALIVSIVTEPDNLFDTAKGIYVLGDTYQKYVQSLSDTTPMEKTANFMQKGKEWEREAHMDIFEIQDGTYQLGLSQEIGIRIHGNTTRVLAQKALNLYAREGVQGETRKNFKYDLFPGDTYEGDETTLCSSYKKLVLRAGGQNTQDVKFKDAWLQELVNSRNFAIQDARPCVLFLDGEYWGPYNFRERFDDAYIANNYSVKKKQVVMIKDGEVEEYDEENITDTEAKNLLNHYIWYIGCGGNIGNESWQTDQAGNYKMVKQLVDIQSLADMYCTEIFYANADWEPNFGNSALWCTVTKEKPSDESKIVWERKDSSTGITYYGLSKWKYMMCDLDATLGTSRSDITDNLKDAEGNPIRNRMGQYCLPYTWDNISYKLEGIDADGNEVVSGNGTRIDDDVYLNLIQNEEFKNLLINTMMDLYNVNFKPEIALKKLDEYNQCFKPLMSGYYERFGIHASKTKPDDPIQNYYTKAYEEMREFYVNRYNYLPKLMKKHYNLKEASEVTILSNCREQNLIQINSIKHDFSGGAFQGKYFSNCPLELKANEVEGYRFSGWTGSDGVEFQSTTAQSTTVTIPAGEVSICANYHKESEMSSPKPEQTPEQMIIPVENKEWNTTDVVKTEKPAKVKIKTVKNVKRKMVKITWKKMNRVDGYEISYGLKKNFKKAKRVYCSKPKVTIRKLKYGKLYYIRVRAYKRISGKKVYGKCSSIKRVKINK